MKGAQQVTLLATVLLIGNFRIGTVPDLEIDVRQYVEVHVLEKMKEANAADAMKLQDVVFGAWSGDHGLSQHHQVEWKGYTLRLPRRAHDEGTYCFEDNNGLVGLFGHVYLQA